jgi:hypothetical protein
LHPGVRSNADKAITFGLKSELERKAFTEQYLTSMPRNEALRLVDTYAFRPEDAEERYFLLYDVSNTKGKRLEDCIYQGCAKATPPFMLGTREYWGTEYPERLKQLRKAYEDIEDASAESR